MIIQEELPYRIYPSTGYTSVTSYTGCWPWGEGMKQYFLSETPESAYRKLKEAGQRGNRVHDTIEMILKGKSNYTPEDYLEYWKNPSEPKQQEYKAWLRTDQLKKEWKMIEAFHNWWVDYGCPKVLITETQCDSHVLKTSGRIDSIFEIHGRKVIVDWKTGHSKADDYYYKDINGKQCKDPGSHIHRNHKIQQAVYWTACEEGEESLQIDQCLIVCLDSGHKTAKELKDISQKHTGIGYEAVPVLRSELPTLIKEFKMCQHIFHTRYGFEFDPDAGKVELRSPIGIVPITHSK